MDRRSARARGLPRIAGAGGGITLAAMLASLAMAQQPAPDARQLYAANCAACHGAELAGGQFAGPLKGATFLATWGDVSAADLHAYIASSMPPGQAGRLDDGAYAALTALILRENGVEGAALADARLPAAPEAVGRTSMAGIGGASQRYPIPPAPPAPDRFANYTPVTQAMLSDPAPENWLTWRRSHAGQGFSPLAQIDTGNVAGLRLAWAQPLPSGETTNEPLVRDGVLYVFGYGDSVHAFDAATGRSMWTYRRQLPEGTALTSKKSLALYGEKVFAATSDLHLVALDARSGRPVWDRQITERPGFRNPGGPLAADGVVMQGLTTQEAGGALIAAFDAETGEPLWSFDTVPKPGARGGETWNGLAADERSGGSVWTSGTYDAASGLALWGTAPTYDTGPLRDRRAGANNDALFTNTTLAFEPRSGRLIWYFQHMKNDQFDLDWVFERIVGTLEVGGQQRRVVITGGKDGLVDALDADTGRYLKTVDLGVQNFILAIDPETGDKTPDPALLPGRDKNTVFICPHFGGGRVWSPTAFNPGTAALFVPLRDTCMDMVPSETGFLSSGVEVQTSPSPGSDGNYGVLQSVDMQTGTLGWQYRQRAPFNTGVLATGGGLLFAGSMDRQVRAFDQANGAELWRSALVGVPNGSPVSYAVDGRQYVAFVTGHGNPLSFGLSTSFTPEFPLPAENSAALYVFALPD